MPTGEPVAAQAILRGIRRELKRADGAQACLLIRGCSHSGKSELLGVIREHLSETGAVPTTRVDAEFTSGTVLVIDDVHNLRPEAVATLTGVVERSEVTVVLACEPRPHRTDLRALAEAIARHGRVFDTHPLSAADIVVAAEELGVALAVEEAAAVRAATGGVRTAVRSALDVLRGCAPRDLTTTLARSTSEWATLVLKGVDLDLLPALALTVSGAGLDIDEVATALDVDAATAAGLIDRARACALVVDADLLLADAVEPLRNLLGDRRFTDIQHRLFGARFDAGLLRPAIAVRLADAGVRDQRLAEFLCAEARFAEPATAAAQYAAAVDAGVDPESIAIGQMDAAAAIGDTATALRIAESVLERPTCSSIDLAAAVRVAGSVWARRGVLRRSADLYTWLGPERVGADAGLAATVLFAVGEPESALDMVSARTAGPPTAAVADAALLATAMQHSITGTAADAVNALARALPTAGGTGPIRPAPVSSTAVAALLCLHAGELPRAAALLAKAREIDRPTDPHWAQHRLLSAWTSMLDGDEDAARTLTEQTGTSTAQTGTSSAAGSQRDHLLAQALRVGLARRSGDRGALALAWSQSQRVLDEVTVDLLCLLPLGELWLAAIRMNDTGRIAHLVAEAHTLLARLGDPAAWASAFHWYGVQAAILAESPADLVPHAKALGAAAATGDPFAATLATAGRTWLRVLRDEVDPQAVEQSARTLSRIGLGWDGARLASEGALRANDTGAATMLLQVARSLRPGGGRAERPTATTREAVTPAAGGPLSDREVEVADLLILGLTYREIGARLYISAKTVEHHVARIRRRLGAGSRSELLSMLRAMGHGRLSTTSS